MPDDLRIFPDDFVPNIQASDAYKRWARSSPADRVRWEAFRDALLTDPAAAVVPTMSTRFGKALVAGGKEHMSISSLVGQVTNPYPPPDPTPPPPDPGAPYFDTDYADGLFKSPWTILFSHTSPGWLDLTQVGPSAGTPDGRCSIVDAPGGIGGKAARFELRDADPGWPVLPDRQKAEIRTDPTHTFNKSTVAYGDVRWFSINFYLPYTASEKFELAQGGSNAYNDICELHTSGNSWSAFSLNPYPQAGNLNNYLYWRVFGGTEGTTANYERINVVQLTDGSGARVTANHNRWINHLWGMRFAADNTGWLEMWVDGVNTYPRTNRPTMWANDFQMYFKHGLYNQVDATYPSGGSVIYFGRSRIGMTKADVD